jgi:hypothetical protein
MGGWHAGKFDFDTRIGGITALNYEKSVVFDNAIDKPPKTQVAPLDDDATSTPRWATRPIQYDPASTLSLSNIGETSSLEAKVRVVNEELSWEPFYATIETSDCVSYDQLTVSPATGTLAPRGGLDIYTDTCKFAVSLNGQESTNDATDIYLVVRTEMDCWTWKLQP